MEKIEDIFSGYLKISDDTFVYNVSNGIVTLLPAQSEPENQFEVWKRVYSCGEKLPEYLFGDDGGHNIAIMQNGILNFSFTMTSRVIRFSTPVIIKASGNTDFFYENLTERWDKFHAITFYGGNINSISSPDLVVELPNYKENDDGTIGIHIRPHTDYTRSINMEIAGEKAILTVSVYQSWSRSCTGRRGAYSLGELDSLIRLEFEEAQGFDRIAKYYHIIKNLVSIMIGQSNISFDTYLSQRNKNNEYFKTATCKIYDYYENYSEINSLKSISIYEIFELLTKSN